MTDIKDQLIVSEAKRKEAEENLKITEEKYRHLFEQAPFCIVLTNMDGIILDINFAGEEIFGYKKDELIGKNYLEFTAYSSKFKPLLKSRLLKLLEGTPIKPAEFPIYRKNGKKVWIHSLISLFELGTETIIQAIIIDINDIKNYELTIKRKLKIEKTISMISARFVGSINIDKTINESLEDLGKLSGASRVYIMLYNEDDTLIPYIYEWCAQGIKSQKDLKENIPATQFPWSLNQYKEKGLIYIRDISELPKEANATKQELKKRGIYSTLFFPIKIKGELYGFLGFDNLSHTKKWMEEDFALVRTSSEIIANALERKWTEETLKGSHQLLAGIISSLTEAIVLIDKDHKIIWANNVALDNFGKNIISKKCYEVLFDRKKNCRKCIADKTFYDGKIHESEIKLILENKNVNYWCTSSSAALNFEGQTELVVLIFRNIIK